MSSTPYPDEPPSAQPKVGKGGTRRRQAMRSMPSPQTAAPTNKGAAARIGANSRPNLLSSDGESSRSNLLKSKWSSSRTMQTENGGRRNSPQFASNEKAAAAVAQHGTTHAGVSSRNNAVSTTSTNRRRRLFHCSCDPDTARARNQDIMKVLYLILKSRTWGILSICATVIMLFGPPLEICFFPDKNFEPYFSAIFTVTFFVLIFDILLNAMVDPEYFLWYCSCCRKCSYGHKENTCCFLNSPMNASFGHHHEELINAHKQAQLCAFGSFLFWMDLLATASFVPEVLWVDKDPFAYRRNQVMQLDEKGLVVSYSGPSS